LALILLQAAWSVALWTTLDWPDPGFDVAVSVDGGLHVSQVRDASLRERIEVGDAILSVDARPIDTRAEFFAALQGHDNIKLGLRREKLRFERNLRPSDFIDTELPAGLRPDDRPVAMACQAEGPFVSLQAVDLEALRHLVAERGTESGLLLAFERSSDELTASTRVVPQREHFYFGSVSLLFLAILCLLFWKLTQKPARPASHRRIVYVSWQVFFLAVSLLALAGHDARYASPLMLNVSLLGLALYKPLNMEFHMRQRSDWARMESLARLALYVAPLIFVSQLFFYTFGLFRLWWGGDVAPDIDHRAYFLQLLLFGAIVVLVAIDFGIMVWRHRSDDVEAGPAQYASNVGLGFSALFGVAAIYLLASTHDLLLTRYAVLAALIAQALGDIVAAFFARPPSRLGMAELDGADRELAQALDDAARALPNTQARLVLRRGASSGLWLQRQDEQWRLEACPRAWLDLLDVSIAEERAYVFVQHPNDDRSLLHGMAAKLSICAIWRLQHSAQVGGTGQAPNRQEGRSTLLQDLDLWLIHTVGDDWPELEESQLHQHFTQLNAELLPVLLVLGAQAFQLAVPQPEAKAELVAPSPEPLPRRESMARISAPVLNRARLHAESEASTGIGTREPSAEEQVSSAAPNMGEQAKRPIDNDLGEQAKRPIDKKTDDLRKGAQTPASLKERASSNGVERDPANAKLKARIRALENELRRINPLKDFEPTPAQQQSAETLSTMGSPVIICGEHGVGKGAVARLAHSQLARGPLVKLNATELPESVLQLELFGDEEGPGVFAAAYGGTLLVSGADRIPLELLQQLIQGSSQLSEAESVRLYFCVDTATPEAAQEAKQLAQSLRATVLEVPPLRAQSELSAVADAMVHRAAMRYGKVITEIESDAVEALQQYSWPGNFREMRDVIERAVLLCTGRALCVQELRLELGADPNLRTADGDEASVDPEALAQELDKLRQQLAEQSEAYKAIEQEFEQLRSDSSEAISPDELDGALFHNTYEEFEKRLLDFALQRASGNKAKAADALGLRRSTFISKLKKYELLGDE
jgi:DNA-binding NtrC family response regulator